MQRKEVLKASPSTFVTRAAELLAGKNVGAILVMDKRRLAGIVTERDTAFRVIARGLDARTTRLADVMTIKRHTIDPNKPFGYALMVVHEHGFRRLPVVEHGRPAGIVSARSAMDPEWEDCASEAQRRKHFRAQC
jgi:CBS domain-containing protein